MYNAKIISESVLHIGISFMEMLIMMYTWGVYTQNQNNAKGLAYMLVCQEPPEVHGSGMDGHYNISNKKGKHVFHIWFGSILNY